MRRLALVMMVGVVGSGMLGSCTVPNPAYTDSDGGGNGDDLARLDTVKQRGSEGGPCYPNKTCNAGLVCSGGTCRRPADAGGDQRPPDLDPNADNDNDGFSFKDGDCDDSDDQVNPGAVEVEGIPCSSGVDCPSGQCLDGYCRCSAAGDCASGKVCSKDEQCRFGGETCVGGTCASSLRCLTPQPGMSSPKINVCRDDRDNDCDGAVDELPASCDTPGQLTATDPYHLARAMGLCGGRACDAANPCPAGTSCRDGACRWIVSATFNSGADPTSRAIVGSFPQSGPFTPREGKSLAVLSSGLADYAPKKTCPQPGTDFTTEQADPNPKAKDKKAYDYTELTLQLKVPTNARSLELHFAFFTAEYPELQYLDTFWVKLESSSFKGNVVFDQQGKPMSVDNALVSICDPDPKKPQTKQKCTAPASQLDGTGFSTDCSNAGPGPTEANGAGTGWVRTVVPVPRGELIKLSFAIYDKKDHLYDTTVLIDQLRWGLVPAGTAVSSKD